MEFQDRIAIVTGAGSGIGRAIALELGRRGAVVTAADLDAAAAATTAAAIGGRATAAPLDVAQAAAVEALVESTLARNRRLDFMFNVAGVAIGGDPLQITLAQWQRAIDVNLWGVIHGTRAALPPMARQGKGQIVNMASIAGLVGFASMTPYAVTKAAVVALSTNLRAEVAALGVGVNVVCPAFVATRIFENASVAGAKTSDLRQLAGRHLPFGMLTAEDAALRTLAGVARNRAVIAFPFHARVLWWLQRLSPALLEAFARRAIRDFRAAQLR